MNEKDKKEIKGYIKKLVDRFDKQIKKIDKNSNDRFEGYLEDLNDRFKSTGEGMVGINQKLDRMEKTLDSHSEQIAKLTVDMTVVKLDIKELKTDMVVVKSDIKELKTDMTIVKSDVKEIKSELKNKVDKSEVLKMNSRISALEVRT